MHFCLYEIFSGHYSRVAKAKSQGGGGAEETERAAGEEERDPGRAGSAAGQAEEGGRG